VKRKITFKIKIMIRKIAVWITHKIGLYKFGVKIDTKFAERRQNKAFKQYGLEALVQADKALRSVNSFVFMDFGTLLGAYRNKNFIPYDCDLDVGILAESVPENLSELLENYGFKHEKQFYVKETEKIVEDVYSYKGIHIDFFVYYTAGEDMYCYLASRHEHKTWQEANRTDGFPCRLAWVPATGFSEIEFLGHNFFAPDKTPQWLEDKYGTSYMTPIKNWSESARPARVKFHTERLYRRYF
jgi:hypothetical protein